MKVSKERTAKSLRYLNAKNLDHTVFVVLLLGKCFDKSYIDQRVACLLRKVVQEIERRISTQAEHLRTV